MSDPNCHRCHLIVGEEPVSGGFIEMDGGWLLNHGFDPKRDVFGHLVLATREHRKEFSNLSPAEAKAFGTNVSRVDSAYRGYWNQRFPEDPIERLYIMYFSETEPQHVHVHFFPRTRTMPDLMKDENGQFMTGKISQALAKRKFVRQDRYEAEIIKLMESLGETLRRKP